MTNILVVDDSKYIRSQLLAILKELGFTNIQEAINGADALEKVKIAMPDVITLDWNMPVMDGLQFLKALRKLPGGKVPKVAFCSSEGKESKIRLVMENGANTYIVKPIDIHIIREKFWELEILP